MDFQPVKGTRDFYPAEMRVRNWIADAWRRVSLRNGFEEYDAPIFEYLDLYTAKSGDEIVSQLFAFEDRGGRKLAIRPEITPSLARMVNAKISALPRPIKWFSIPRVCRAERPQKGRLREFFQWNVDIIGESSPLADAECVLVAVDALRELGLTSADVKVRYSSRAVLGAVLAALGVSQDASVAVLAALDKRLKVPADVFQKMLAEALPAEAAREGVVRLLDLKDGLSASAIAQAAGVAATPELEAAVAALLEFQRGLASLGIDDWCVYDTNVVRGLAYYTGIVYEIYDAGESLRAVAGGGRYDNLLAVLGGPQVGGAGFGMGDVVLGILLAEKGKLPADLQAGALDYFVIDAEPSQPELFAKVLELVAGLRKAGRSADFSYKRQALGKQLKSANQCGARQVVIVQAGDKIAVKDLATGTQRETTIAEFLASSLKA